MNRKFCTYPECIDELVEWEAVVRRWLGQFHFAVASETLLWQEGKILLFDDSYEHEVWNDGETPRAVLIIDLWHPEIVDESVRDVIRSVLGIGAKGTTAEQMQRQ